MKLRIDVFNSHHEPAARRFNARMLEAHAATDFLLPETVPGELDLGLITKRHLVVLDGDEIRAGVYLQAQPAWVAGTVRNVWNIQSPVSEGITNPQYNFVALFMLRELLKRNPLIYSIGMGSETKPYPRLLKALGWNLTAVPFFFHVLRAKRFIRNLQLLRRDPLCRLVADVSAECGLGPSIIHAWQALRVKRPTPASNYDSVERFGEWADEVWKSARQGISFSIERKAEVLNELFPATLERLFRIQVSSGGATVGWAALLISTLHKHHHFGDMRLGTIVDFMSIPGKEQHIVGAALRSLSERGVDLVVSNEAQEAMQSGFRGAGFLSGPSNYFLGISPELAAAIPKGPHKGIHVSRADGDGICTL